jgi:hypothetical protein
VLGNITFPSSLESLGDYSFSGLSVSMHPSNRTEIDLSGTKLKNIGDYAFNQNRAVTSVKFPATLESIDRYAFNQCHLLNVIDFSACTALEFIGYSAFSTDGMLGNTNQTITSLVLPNSLKRLGSDAFRNMHNLKTITLPSSILSVYGGSDSIVWGSVALEKFIVTGTDGFLETDTTGQLLIFNGSVIDIAHSTTGTITVPEGVTGIGSNAFQHSKATSIILPATLEVISSSAFSYQPNPAGQITVADSFAVTIHAVTPPRLVSSGNFNNTKLTNIYVPAASVDAYKEEWTSYAEKITAIED